MFMGVMNIALLKLLFTQLKVFVGLAKLTTIEEVVSSIGEVPKYFL